MAPRILGTSLSLACGLLAAHAAAHDVELEFLGRYETGSFATGASEISAFDPATRRAFVTNGATGQIDVLDLADPTAPAFLFAIDLSPWGSHANSVSAFGGVVVAAVEADAKTDPGQAVFFDTDGAYINAVEVGALPDMITFTHNGRYVLVANEGEPDDAYAIDPEGSVSVIDLRDGAAHIDQGDVRTAGFGGFDAADLDPSVRIFGPGASVAQDMEPEYITSSDDERWAWVTLQENNAIGIIDIRHARVVAIRGLGFKNYNRPGQGIDASDRDGGINIRNWPVRGMYQPDAIASFERWGIPFLVMANEGDSRDYGGFSEEARIGGVTLDPTAFPNAADLQSSANLGRLKITTTLGDTDGDGDYDRLYAYGARSFSIRLPDGTLIFDSGDDLEQLTAALLPADFNSDDEENDSFDSRSDDKGPEPEGVAVGRVGNRTYAFIGLERVGGMAVYDVTNPFLAHYAGYINTRDFAGDPVAGTAGDMSPEGLLFVSAEDSPNGDAMIIMTNEVSGTTATFRVRPN
ncbi:MAG: choice-of-anchor I family protein [bacterium]